MKLPSSVGQKKIKAIEQILVEQGVGKCEFAPLTHLMAKSFTYLQQNKLKKKRKSMSFITTKIQSLYI